MPASLVGGLTVDWSALGPVGGSLATVASGVLGIIALRQRAALREREKEAADAEARKLHAQERVLAQESENTAQHALIRAQEDTCRRLEKMEAALESARKRADVQEQALGNARDESSALRTSQERLAWELEETRAELATTRAYVAELQAQNAAQAGEISTLRGRLRDLEAELHRSEKRAEALAHELHETKMAIGSGCLPASPLTPLPPPYEVRQRMPIGGPK